jgi:predicted ATPase
VGSKGENIIDFLQQAENDLDVTRIPELLMAKESGALGVQESIKEWLGIMSPGVDFKYVSDFDTDIGRTQFDGHRPVHVGFGLSYVLPVIASVIIHSAQLYKKAVDSVLLLIENPEAHLHPSGQTKMGELMARASACGVQILVETHSDHFLNGVRLAVKDGWQQVTANLHSPSSSHCPPPSKSFA